MMFLTKKFYLILALMLFCILLSACGPSPEELEATSAAQTAAAATNTPLPPTITPTPTPTHTPTPVPYDLSLIVAGEEDAPVIGASVILAEIDDIQITDDFGQTFWNDLPGESVSLSVSAQGYFPKDIADVMERGINQLTINLDRDPHGVLPSEACGPGEQLLYQEDFQDGMAQGLEGIEFRVQGWDIGPHPNSQGNTVLINRNVNGAGTGLEDHNFENGVWRIKFMTDNLSIFELSWRHKPNYEIDAGHVDGSSYSLRIEPGALVVFRKVWPLSNLALINSSFYLQSGTWQEVEISTYKGMVEVWLNGRRILAYEDPYPLPDGTIDIGIEEPLGDESTLYIDDIAVCELSAPYEPMPTSEP